MKAKMINQIRAEFRRSGMSILELSKQSDVAYASVHGALKGTRDPVLATAERLCDVLGLELSPIRRGKRKGR